MIIDVGQAMLEKLGYRVVACWGGQEAVTAITRMRDKIDLVILDLVMPGMDGGKTFDRIREIRPERRCCSPAGMPPMVRPMKSCKGAAADSFKNLTISRIFHLKCAAFWMKETADLSTGFSIIRHSEKGIRGIPWNRTNCLTI